MPSGKRLTVQENNRFVENGIFATGELIDRALRMHGKNSLYEKDDNGVIPLDKILAPIRRQYEKWVPSFQMLDDYDRDPNESEEDKNLVLLWWMDHDSVTRSQAQQAQDTYSMWGYRKYLVWVVNALYRYAKEQGLSDEDIASARTPLVKWVADAVRKARMKNANKEATEQ